LNEEHQGESVMTPREERGLIIAAKCHLHRNADGTWRVPSQSHHTEKVYYTVNLETKSCTCPDCQESGFTCKHFYAATIVHEREVLPDGTMIDTESVTLTKKTVYKQDWPKYNAAQTSEGKHFRELLADLCRTIPEPERKPRRGRPNLPLADSIYSAIYKVYSTFSARRFQSELEEAHKDGLIGKLPSFNSVLNAFDDAGTTAILHDLIRKSSVPLAQVETKFAVDSSGFCTSKFIKWFDVKYGVTRQQAQWVKAHIVCGTTTHVVPAVTILDKDAGDSPQLPELVKQTARDFTIDEVSADKAYAGTDNFSSVDHFGGTLYAAFKSNTTGAIGGIFEKMFHQFCLNKDEYMQHYHKRSNVESVFSMVKRKHGDAVRSKNDVAQKNEVLAKFVCHNICCLISARYELGIEADFCENNACTENDEPAQLLRFPGA
jgi:transposase